MFDAKELGIKVVKESGNEQHCICPFHSDHSPSASFNRVKGVLYCYVCTRSWTVTQLQDALGVVVGYRDVEPADFDLLDADVHLDLGEKRYHPYFEKRGIIPTVIDLYGVRWKETIPQAAVLPITNPRGEVGGVAYRYLSGESRYKVFGRTTPVWPMHIIRRIRPRREIIVTEGAWSAMRIASIRDIDILPLALLGAKASIQIVNSLFAFNVTFLYDQDAAGERACQKMREMFPAARCFTVSPSPDDMSEAQIHSLFAKLGYDG